MMIAIIPVSYTHLLAEILLRYEMWDGISLLANLAAWMLLFAYLSIIFFLLKYIIAHGAVSYTHLDLYRQEEV